ncbi:MAG: hypothetical protein HY787_08885 [Deltaproteobacteria bacterium]|nr:hypothetical protein [Deltaproteobacteria bacterium]
MAVSGKYGQVNIPKVGVGEPIFILRAQDKLAVAVLEMYQALVRSHGSPLTNTVQKEIERFERWGGPKKIPD